MTHFRRIVTEQVSQVIGIASGFLDRFVLTAVLFRFWGASLFETWSVCVALAGLVSLFEFGFSLYFNNRIMIEAEQGRHEKARHCYLLSNTILVTCALAGFLVVACFVLLYSPQGEAHSEASSVAVLALSAASAFRIAAGGPSALYRAHREYARLVLIQVAAEVLRIVVALCVALLGGRLVAVSIGAAAAIIAVQFMFVVFDTRRRFGYPFAFALPRRRDMGEVLSMSMAYFAQLVPIILLTYLPVLLIHDLSAQVGLLAGFVTLRMLSALPRTFLQSGGIVIGQECARRFALKDSTSAFTVLSEAMRMFAVLSGLATGVLLGGGREIVQLWTGDADLFRFDQFLAAVLPMALAANSVLAHNVLAASNAPYLAAAGRWLQFALTAAIMMDAPVRGPVLRMFLALSLGEMLGFVPLVYYAVARLVPAANFVFQAKAILLTIVAAAIGAGATSTILAFADPGSAVSKCLALALALSICGTVVPWLGLSQTARNALMTTMILPQLVRLGIGPQKGS
jgi:O-antigen/teichoic acid export membrane protein